MMTHTRSLIVVALGLGLFTALPACDGEPGDELDAELAERHATQIQHQLELEDDVELERVSSDDETLEFDGGLADEPIRFTEITELAPPTAEANCGPGHWEYQSRSVGCDTCQFDEDETGKKYNHYKRWCWDGPPSCGGCGGWQYTGWSCLHGCW